MEEEISIKDLKDLDNLTPQLFNVYIDLVDNVFVVDILTSKKIYTELSRDDNFKKLLNKQFHQLHENLLYGLGSTQCTGYSEMNILDVNDEFKVVNTDSLNKPELGALFGYSVFNALDIELETIANHECSKLYKDVENEEYRIKIAYNFKEINLELLRHILDNTLFLLD